MSPLTYSGMGSYCENRGTIRMGYSHIMIDFTRAVEPKNTRKTHWPLHYMTLTIKRTTGTTIITWLIISAILPQIKVKTSGSARPCFFSTHHI